MYKLKSLVIVSFIITACGGGGGGGYGSNSMNNNMANDQPPAQNNTAESGITLYTSDGEIYSGDYHQMEDGTYHSGSTHDATLPEGHQILSEIAPENPTATPNTTVNNNVSDGGQAAENNVNNPSGYGLAQSQFNIFNNIYEAEEITFLSDIPEDFQLPFKDTTLSIFTTSNIANKNSFLSTLERFSSGLTLDIKSFKHFDIISLVGVSHVSGYGDFDDAFGQVLGVKFKHQDNRFGSLGFKYSNFSHPYKGYFYNFDREDKTYELNFRNSLLFSSRNISVNLSYKNKKSSLNSFDFDLLRLNLEANF